MTDLFPTVAVHAAGLAVFLIAAAGAGALVAGPRLDGAARLALGLALAGHALFVLALAGELRPVPIALLAALCAAGWLRMPRLSLPTLVATSAGAVWAIAILLIALRPPLAFDETLYHLPFVRALAESGAMRFAPDLRFPAFPQLHELLCVPMFLAGGAVATHLVSLGEFMVTAALLWSWGRQYGRGAGFAAAGFFVGSPIAIHLATINYVDAALTCFVTAGFYALDRFFGIAGPRTDAANSAVSERSGPTAWLLAAGAFLGTACSVKYLGGYFAVAAFVAVAIRSRSFRTSSLFAVPCALAAVPTTLWITLQTGDPLFPFFRKSIWNLPLETVAPAARLIRVFRVGWDVTSGRERLNLQPPFTPFFLVAVAIAFVAAFRSRRARAAMFVIGAYLVVFAFLPQDSRYLVPLIPLVSIVASVAICRWNARLTPWAALLAVVPGVAYTAYSLSVRGLPPPPARREAWLEHRVPEYRALAAATRETLYVCAGEQLKGYAKGRLLGDFAGPFSYDRVLHGARSTSAIAARLRTIGASQFLLARRGCSPPAHDGGMELVYEDDAAQLWRVR